MSSICLEMVFFRRCRIHLGSPFQPITLDLRHLMDPLPRLCQPPGKRPRVLCCLLILGYAYRDWSPLGGDYSLSGVYEFSETTSPDTRKVLLLEDSFGHANSDVAHLSSSEQSSQMTKTAREALANRMSRADKSHKGTSAQLSGKRCVNLFVCYIINCLL